MRRKGKKESSRKTDCREVCCRKGLNTTKLNHDVISNSASTLSALLLLRIQAWKLHRLLKLFTRPNSGAPTKQSKSHYQASIRTNKPLSNEKKPIQVKGLEVRYTQSIQNLEKKLLKIHKRSLQSDQRLSSMYVRMRAEKSASKKFLHSRKVPGLDSPIAHADEVHKHSINNPYASGSEQHRSDRARKRGTGGDTGVVGAHYV